ncbi:uncharacterized protein LOC121378841 [Gigantopelta aegis]|uniref:uncharacterized protein LOC121378841 n=1 Tax=Gigantopelta aegis TaxID=1735272 RepID=UPI001B88D3BD|nr:uncharacterized protein LOC121378841 [Gigantopelta aegis]
MQVRDSRGQFVAKGDILTFNNPDNPRKLWAIYVGNRGVVLVGPSGVRETKLDDVGGEIVKDNILDEIKEPRRAHEIIERAHSQLGQTPPESQSDDGGHGFVIWCRYGNEPADTSHPPRADMPPVDVDSSGAVLQLADAVRFDCGQFSHWAVYVGNGDVIHKTAQGVLKQPLREVAGENPFLKDNSMDDVQRPFMTQGILDMARTRLGDKSYNWFNNNCEIFVNQVRCGNGKSRQISEYLESHNVGSFEFSEGGPQGGVHTVHVVSGGGSHSSSHTMSSSSSSSSGGGHVHTYVTGNGVATAVTSGPGGVFTSVSPPGTVTHGLPPPPPNMEQDLYCVGCHGGKL